MDPSFWQPFVGILTIQLIGGGLVVGAVLTIRDALHAHRMRLGSARVVARAATGGVLIVLALADFAALLLYGAVAGTVLLWQVGAAACRGC